MSLSYHEIAEVNHRILNPFTQEKLMLLGDICRLKPEMHQLDLACGKGEMLCQWARAYGTSGTGVDISAVFLEAARQRADELQVSSRVDFIHEDAVHYQASQETYDVVSCIGANWLGGGTKGTLELIKGKGLKSGPDRLILMGEIFWRGEPSQDALEGMGVQPGEWAVGLDGIVGLFEASGARVVEMVLATDTDWDRYESKHWWAFDEWMKTNPNNEELETFKAIANKSRQDYFRYERPLCDWGVFVLKVDI